MIDIAGLREDKRPQSSTIVHALLDRLEAAEKERDAAELMSLALQAKIEAMEQQEPVGTTVGMPGTTGFTMACFNADKVLLGSKLYALPGAQSGPSVPAEWLPVPENHPTFDPVDLQLSDGSVLCGCVPQSDGDYWWEGPSGEVFIDPKYANVTHWRLAAAPEESK